MNSGKVPQLAWSNDELDDLPSVYVSMIKEEHELSVARYYAEMEWAKAEAEKKALAEAERKAKKKK